MGVLAGRIPRKVDEGFLERLRIKLGKILKGFTAFGENFGVAVAGREVDFRKDNAGIRLFKGLEDYGVAGCYLGAGFWKGSE